MTDNLMNRFWKLLGLILIGMFFLAACRPQGVSYKEDDYVIPLDADFKSSQDLLYFDIAEQLEPGEELQDDSAGDLLQDGAIVLGGPSSGGANFKARVNFDNALHIRWKVNAEDTCNSLALWPFVEQEKPLDGSYGVGVSGCSFQSVQVSVNSDEGISLPGNSIGTIITDEGKWLDTVMWIEDEGTPVFRAFVWETENPDLYIAGKKVLSGQEGAAIYQFSFELYSGSIAVDSFRLLTGDAESYLWFHAPAFRDNYEIVSELFSSAQ